MTRIGPTPATEGISFQRSVQDRWLVALLSFMAFAWRVAGIDYQSLWRDETDTLRFATRELPTLFTTFSKPGENGPLFFLLMRPWLDSSGTSEFALRYPAALAGVLAIPLTYVIAARILRAFGTRPETGIRLANVPLVAALLVAANPYLHWYSQEGKMYALLLVLVLGAHLAFLAAADRGGLLRWLAYLTLLGTAALVHLLSVLIVPLHVVWLLLLWPRNWRRWAGFAATLLLPLIPYSMLVGWWQARLFFDPDFQTGHPFVPLNNILTVLLVGFTRGVASIPNALVLAPVIFLLLAGIALGSKAVGTPTWQLGARRQALLVSWLLLPPLLLFAITLAKPIFTDRYMIWISPAFAILVAQGSLVVAQVWRPLGWSAVALMVVLGLQAGWRQTHVPIKSDFRAAAAYVSAHRQPGDRLLYLIPHVRHTFEYYAGTWDNWTDGPYTNHGNPEEQVAQETAQAVGDASGVWLISSEEDLWDARALLRRWLEANGRPARGARFTRVEVIRYEMEPHTP